MADDDKKRDLIYEAPKSSVLPSVRELMDAAEKRVAEAHQQADLGPPLEVYFHIKNSRVLYTFTSGHVDSYALADLIIKAVRDYGVEPIKKEPIKKASAAQIGAPLIEYDRFVRVDWTKQTVFTNFKPSEGEIFLSAMALIVNDLRAKRASEAPGGLS